MIGHEWPWRHSNAGSPQPTYLQPARTTGPVRFDRTLQTAADIMRASRARSGAGAGEPG